MNTFPSGSSRPIPPPSTGWAGGYDPRPSGGPSPIGMMLVGALIFGIGCGSGLVTGWFGRGAFFFGLGSGLGGAYNAAMQPVDASITVTKPDQVKVGETFDLVMHITDSRGEARRIESVDVYEAIADQFEYISQDPAPTSQNVEYGYREYTLTAEVAPLGTTDIVFRLKAKSPGIHSGTVYVYLDAYQSIETEITIEVTAE